jgi:hypothetical protein
MAPLRWTVNRDNQNDKRTYGSILRPDGSAFGPSRFGDSIELPWKNDLPQVSCIPGNILYTLDFRWSNDHKGPRWWFQNVRARSACELHSANIPGQLRGCMAPGFGRMAMMAIDGFEPQDGVTNSRQALQQFMTECGLPDFLSLTTEAAVNAFVAAHSELCVIEMQVNDIPGLAAAPIAA